MLRRLTVFDAFYRNPDALRETALKLKYYEPSDITGCRSKPVVVPGTKRRLEEVLHVKIREWSTRGDRGYDNGVFFMSLANGPHAERPQRHYDWYNPDFITAVVYLTPDAPSDSGTSFWRHKPTALEAMPSPEECPRLVGLTFAELDAMLEADASNYRKWVEIDRVANRYNRAVFYPPHFFHSATRHFGTRLATGRIYQSFNFKIDGDSRYPSL